MPEEYKTMYMARHFKLHRAFYAVLLSVVLLCYFHKISPEPTTLAYYIIAILLCAVMDEYFLWRKFAVPKKFFSVRAFLAILFLSGGTVFGPPHPMEFIPFLLFEIVLIYEDMILNDIFDDFGIFIRRVLYLFLIMVSMALCFRNLLSGVWVIIEILIGASIVGVCFILFHSFVDGLRMYEKKATDIHFKYVNLEEERNKLLKYQDRVEQVNSEINFQKFNLVKANRELANKNEEVRSLIEVMKYFSSNFDVPENARRMMENIMELKNPTACGIYIKEHVYLNKDPYCAILTGNDSYEEALERDFITIYDMVQRRRSPDPLMLCENGDFLTGVLSDTNVVNALAIPAYINDEYYGVMVIMSGTTDFFESGYSFYESSLVDFTSSVQSAKLYLQMKDMAVKDGLTGVYNRAYFNEIFPSICAKCVVDGKSLSMALLDIDKFKSINDTYGHLAGDEVIRMVASVDRKYADLYHGYAVRYGGEEFLLILPGYSVQEFREILQKVHDEIVRNVVRYEKEQIHVNASIGMSNYPEIATEIVDVLDQSDQAMYFSKEHGRGMIVIYGREKECLIEAGRTEYLEETTKPYDSDDSDSPDSNEDGGSEAENRNETESTGSIGVITDISETPKKNMHRR